MKNIEKKWTLFLIATFATFYGIADTLLDKSTSALEDELVYADVVDITFDENVVFDEENFIISNITSGSKISDIITTEGNISLYENDGTQIDSINALKTGDKIKIVFDEDITYEYKVSVYGDTNGDGKITSKFTKFFSINGLMQGKSSSKSYIILSKP